MNRILIYIILIVSAFLVAMTPSCSNEESVAPKPLVTIPDDPFKDGELPINLPVTRAVNDGEAENKITSARLIVIKNSVVTNNKPFDIINGHLAHNDSVYVSDTIPVGTVDMFIIVNEITEWSLSSIAKGSIYFPEDIERKTLTFSAEPIVDATHPPIPMYRQYRNLSVSKEGVFTPADGSDDIPMNLLGLVERLYAKVTLVLEAKFSEMTNGGDPIKIDSISIKSMPKHSYLTPIVGFLYPVSGGYFNGHVWASSTNESGNYAADGVGLRDSLIWYIPEHRLSDTTYLTYISVKASLKDNLDPDRQVEFKKIILGDGAENIPQDNLRIGSYNNLPISLDNWFITRNTHYKVNATIINFDEANESEMDILMKVVGWTLAPIDSTIIRQNELKVSQDAFYYNTAEFEGAVTIETNHPEGWSVTVAPPQPGDWLVVSNGGTYGTTLSNQTGTLLRFQGANWTPDSKGYIDVKAGQDLVKRIKITRNP